MTERKAMTQETLDVVKSFNLEGLFKTRGDGATEVTLIHQITEGKGAACRKFIETIANSELEDTIWASEEIHFMRFTTINNDTQLLFTSNFDGSVETYLADFLVHMPDHLDALWGYCDGYPEKGAGADFAGFMKFIVSGYVPCQFFFAAYPDATVKQVWRALDWEKKTRDFQRTLARPTPSRGRDESSAQRVA